MKQLRPAIALTLWFVVVFGLAFPAAIYGIGRLMPSQADGSMIANADGKVVGSSLIGQSFAKPEYFHPRPSAAGAGFDPTASGGTNLGPTSDKLVNGVHKKTPDGKDDPGNFDGVEDLVAAYRTENGLQTNSPIPADAVTRSASGLDPDISVENANLQTSRIARSRHMKIEDVRRLIALHTSSRFLGIFGEPVVNVLQLNLALDRNKN